MRFPGFSALNRTLLATLLLGAGWPDPAQAFTLLTRSDTDIRPTLGWQTDTLVFDYNLTDCPGSTEFKTLVQNALAIWNGVRSSKLTLELGEETSVTLADVVAGDTSHGRPILFCSTTDLANTSIYGYAFNTTMATDGRIFFSAILLNNASGDLANAFSDPEVGAAVVAHEIGHVLGLGHTSIDSALMYYSISSTQASGVTQDDIDGLTYLYPRSEPGDGFLGCGTVSMGAGRGGPRGPQGPLEFCLLMALAWLASWRARHRANFAGPGVSL